MIVFDRQPSMGQDSSNVPLVTVVEPVGSSVSASKKYYLFGDKYITIKLQITNTTQYSSFALAFNWQELGKAPQSKAVAFTLKPGATTTVSEDLTISDTPATVGVSAWINAMYTPTQPVSEAARVADLQLAVG